MEVLFPEYFQNISRIIPYHGKHFHTLELDKTMEIGFSIFFYNISKICPYYGKGAIFPVCSIFRFVLLFSVLVYFTEKQSFKSFGAVLCNEGVNWYWFALIYVCNILYILNTK